MKRAVQEISKKLYDIAIIGGGIYGASIVRDAALRGLSVALVDMGDFGSGTSANSHKIIHGGLRYLQHGDVKRMRESIRERSSLLRIAPHLVYAMPFLIPTYKNWVQGKLAMGTVLKLNDLIGFDRNHNLQRDKTLPKGHLISKAECLKLCPGLDHPDLVGGAIFYDGQVYNPDRFTFSVLRSATAAGADLANYVRAVRLLKEEKVVVGFLATDILTGKSFEVRAKLVVNCSGPRLNTLLSDSDALSTNKKNNFLKAMVLVTRQLVAGVAVGFPGKSYSKDQDALINKERRYFFITPWRAKSLIGTFQKPYEGDPSGVPEFKEQEIQEFIDEVNGGFQGAKLTKSDVDFVYAGFLPRVGTDGSSSDAQLVKHSDVIDHEEHEKLKGLVSVIGVKYTTARHVAEKVVDLALKKLGKKSPYSSTAYTPLPGGDIDQLEKFTRNALECKPDEMTTTGMEHLIRTYGTDCYLLLQYGDLDRSLLQPVCLDSPVMKVEIIHAVRNEMAQKLSDVILRRTELGTAGFPGDDCLETCAAIMAKEMNWGEQKTKLELDEVRNFFRGKTYG